MLQMRAVLLYLSDALMRQMRADRAGTDETVLLYLSRSDESWVVDIHDYIW